MPSWKYVFVVFDGSLASIYNSIAAEQLEYKRKILVVVNNAKGWREAFEEYHFDELVHLNSEGSNWTVPLIKILKSYNLPDVVVITPFTYDNKEFAKTTTTLSQAGIYSIAFSKDYTSENIENGISKAKEVWLAHGKS
ncbi:hypothetical protein [Thermococcus sp.]|uniref:hypothetical protein n=1 Tax=Thermococcus sp. TaxID=35749 RepID=UPI0019C186D7|nr:hypothetical protein [Thermococcus sp.]MBC7094490.1 hypothetical protein [Thermococcus sp.]